MKTVLKNAHLVVPDETKHGDLLIEDGLIEKIGGSIDAPGAEEIDCSDKWILPGVIDAHVHFRSPGYEYKEDWKTGSKAALAGGVTTVFDMPNTNPQTTTAETLEHKRGLARKESLVNFGLFLGATGDNIDVINHAEGIVGVKVYMGQTTGQTIDDPDEALDTMLRDLFERTHRVIAVHAEDEAQIRKHMKTYKGEEFPEIHSLIRNDSVAYTASRRAVHIAKKYSGRLHICHLSTKKEVALLTKYPDENITAEVAPHHLFFTVSDYAQRGTLLKMNPPLRSHADVDTLWEALVDGTIPMIATDHAPHLKKEKLRGYWDAPAGVPGVEMVLPLLLDSVHEKMLDIHQVVSLVCEGPARVYGVKNKGRLKEGYDADLAVVDMDMMRTVHDERVMSKCGWTPYDGMDVRGWPIMTFVGGRLMMENGSIVSGHNGREVELV